MNSSIYELKRLAEFAEERVFWCRKNFDELSKEDESWSIHDGNRLRFMKFLLLVKYQLKLVHEERKITTVKETLSSLIERLSKLKAGLTLPYIEEHFCSNQSPKQWTAP